MYIFPGPPSEIINGPDEDSNLAVVQAFIHNRSNCVYVYNHFSQGPWFTPQVAHLVEGGVPREAIVAVADLGYADTREVLAARLKDACKCSGLKQIDFAIVRVGVSTRVLINCYIYTHTLDWCYRQMSITAIPKRILLGRGSSMSPSISWSTRASPAS